MALLGSLNTGASGVQTQGKTMQIVGNNIANVNTTRTETGEPFRRKMVVFMPRPDLKGVHIPKNGIREDHSLTNPLQLRYDPGHPDADENGYVHMPNVNIVSEMVDLISATRAYEANVQAINAAKTMAREALSIGRNV